MERQAADMNLIRSAGPGKAVYLVATVLKMPVCDATEAWSLRTAGGCLTKAQQVLAFQFVRCSRRNFLTSCSCSCWLRTRGEKKVHWQRSFCWHRLSACAQQAQGRFWTWFCWTIIQTWICLISNYPQVFPLSLTGWSSCLSDQSDWFLITHFLL